MTEHREYQYALKRLAKVTKTVEQLIDRNVELSKANEKLRATFDSFEQREAARERILAKNNV